ncbi:MAG: acyl-CoA dehydrogenase family protein [Deltaproteobacteria bacterium]|nr:acyl-CoA dehydrogenase family protein [Deltaproteobacteria bacterium]
MVFFTAEQQRFQTEIRDFARRELRAGARERAGLDRVQPEVLRKLADAGLLGRGASVAYAPTPTDAVTFGILIEEVCRVDYTAMIVLLVGCLVYGMAEWMTEEVRGSLLPAFAAAGEFVCFANTEPGCGSDAAAIATTAVRDGDGYLLCGEKTSISGGLQADSAIITAKTDPSAGVKGVSLFYVPLAFPGVSRSGFRDMGNLSAARASLALDRVRVPASYRIGPEGEGFSKVMRTFDASRVYVGLSALALAQASLDEAAEHVKERQAFGRPLSHFEGVSFRLAEHATLVEAARLLCYEALKLRDEGKPHSREAAMAKWFGPKCAVDATHEMLLLCGHQGYSDERMFGIRWRDAVSTQLGDGTAEIMKLIVARELLGARFAPRL